MVLLFRISVQLLFGQQSVNPSREAISIVSGKYKRFTFVYPVEKCYDEY